MAEVEFELWDGPVQIDPVKTKKERNPDCSPMQSLPRTR
jgi:hypothetical protein